MSPASLHIPVVNDHDESLVVPAKLLQRCGHSADTARTYAEAMEAAGRRRYDLVISDVGLPDRSGLELMHELQAQYAIKGIALSGFTDEPHVRASRSAGFDRHLNKPVIFPDLVAAIEEVSGARPPPDAVPQPLWNSGN